MGKYLTNFKTKEEYEAFKAGGSYLTPNVSFIETAGSVINDSYQVPTSGGGSGVQADDLLWMTSIYVGFPFMNVSKGKSIDFETNEEVPLTEEIIIFFAQAFGGDPGALSGYYGLSDVSVSNKTEFKIRVMKEDAYGNTELEGGMFTGITIEGVITTESGESETFRGVLVEGCQGANYGWLLYLKEEDKYFHEKYKYSSVTEVKITKFIASNGNEIIVPEY